MNTLSLEHETLLAPSETEAALAKETSHRLASLLGDRREVYIQLVEDDHPTETLAIPASALRLLAQILAEMAQGNAVTVTPIHAELSTQQAADLLNVSRPFLVQLLEKGEIPFHKVGAHRRIRFKDLLAYKQERYARRQQALAELAAYDQELGLE
ncbi:MAG: DNA-binding protein [Chloroflexi bacterium]|nr:MAG: DNA-binding protein [Chloroflexota bacterium]